MKKIQLYFKKELSLKQINDTFIKSFNQKFNLEYWKWRFLQNPNNKKIYISYVIENDILASYYAVSPCTIYLNGIKHKIALSNMTMTHPDYQGKGYFKQVALGLYSKLKEDGFIGVYGFANKNSHYGFRKYLNWHDLAAINTFQVKQDSFRYFLLKMKDEFDFEVQKIADNKLDFIDNMVINKSIINLSRDKKNIRWRLSDNPDNKYFVLNIIKENQISGTLLFKYFNTEEVDIMEFFIDQNVYNIKSEIIGAGINYLLKDKAKKINIWSNLHSSEHLYLEKLGFNEKDFNTYFGVIPFVSDSILLDVKNWHYRFFDSDVY